MYFDNDIKLNPPLGICIIFLPGNMCLKRWSRKGKHWFPRTNCLPNSFPYLGEAVCTCWNECKFLFATVSIDSKITYQNRCPPKSTSFPLYFLGAKESHLVGHEVAHLHPVSQFPFWETLAVSPREVGGKNCLELPHPSRGFAGNSAGRFSDSVACGSSSLLWVLLTENLVFSQPMSLQKHKLYEVHKSQSAKSLEQQASAL